MEIAQVMKLSGHTEIETIYEHYLRLSDKTMGKAADLLNRMHDATDRETADDATGGYVN